MDSFDAVAVSYPMPELGDVFVRETEPGRPERALIISIYGSDQDWAATMYGRTGREAINGTRERKTIASWRPESWVWDDKLSTFKPPGSAWDVKSRCFKRPDEILPELEDIPSPAGNEKKGQWRGRIKREFPILCDHVDAENVLEAAWAAHEARLAAVLASVTSGQLGRELTGG